ncbi:hypothetical protein Btru_019282 [Bulinus truncatus]|nr:hypothetical protein Btru_019282 [Bulinus truncatus]
MLNELSPLSTLMDLMNYRQLMMYSHMSSAHLDPETWEWHQPRLGLLPLIEIKSREERSQQYFGTHLNSDPNLLGDGIGSDPDNLYDKGFTTAQMQLVEENTQTGLIEKKNGFHCQVHYRFE